MRVLCAISGLDFEAEHFPGFLANRECVHPIFQMPQKKLLAYTGQFYTDALTPTDKYLLFLAVLNSSDLVDFRVSVFRTPFTPSIIAQNFERLVRIVCKMNAVLNPNVTFPRYILSYETRNLSNVHFWIDNWYEAYKEYQSGSLRSYESKKLGERERALERLIKNPHKPVGEYASQIADWAIIAGDVENQFRQQTPNPFTGKSSSMAEFWRTLIIKAARLDSLYAIEVKDLDEIIEHFETKLDVLGSIYSHQLLKILRTAQEKRKNFLGMGDLTVASASYQILSTDDSVEASNMKLMIDLAPETEPKASDYPDRVSYIRAKMRYQMAQASGKFSAAPTN